MLSTSKPQSKGLLHAGLALLFVTALLGEGPSDITGTWKADVSKTTPPDNNESAVALTIKETGPHTYDIRLESQTTDRGLRLEQRTIVCDGKSRPLKTVEASAKGGTIFCGRSTEIAIRVKKEDGTLMEQVFKLPERNSLIYTKTVAGHDQTYLFSRQ